MIRKREEVRNERVLKLKNKGNACVYCGIIHRKRREEL
jgi:hypothetical protein